MKPLRDGDTEIEEQYRELFGANAIRLLEASYPVFEDAARLRAEARLNDAGSSRCALFVTNDTDFRRVEGLPIAVLDDLADGAALSSTRFLPQCADRPSVPVRVRPHGRSKARCSDAITGSGQYSSPAQNPIGLEWAHED